MQRYLVPRSKTFVPVSSGSIPEFYAGVPTGNIDGVSIELVETARGVYTMYTNHSDRWVDLDFHEFESTPRSFSKEFSKQSYSRFYLGLLAYVIGSAWVFNYLNPEHGLEAGLLNLMALLALFLSTPSNNEVIVQHACSLGDSCNEARDSSEDEFQEESSRIEDSSDETEASGEDEEVNLGDSEDDEHLARLHSRQVSASEASDADDENSLEEAGLIEDSCSTDSSDCDDSGSNSEVSPEILGQIQEFESIRDALRQLDNETSQPDATAAPEADEI